MGLRECLDDLDALESCVPECWHGRLENIREHLMSQHQELLEKRGQLGPYLYCGTEGE